MSHYHVSYLHERDQAYRVVNSTTGECVGTFNNHAQASYVADVWNKRTEPLNPMVSAYSRTLIALLLGSAGFVGVHFIFWLLVMAHLGTPFFAYSEWPIPTRGMAMFFAICAFLVLTYVNRRRNL